MSEPFDSYPPSERRGFARLLAEAMRPHLQQAMDAAVEEYIGQNGEQHKTEHRALQVLLKELQEQKVQTTAARRQVRTGVIISLILLLVTVVGQLLIYWITTVNRAQIEEIRRDIPLGKRK